VDSIIPLTDTERREPILPRALNWSADEEAFAVALFACVAENDSFLKQQDSCSNGHAM
jgi:hypothetical protein